MTEATIAAIAGAISAQQADGPGAPFAIQVAFLLAVLALGYGISWYARRYP